MNKEDNVIELDNSSNETNINNTNASKEITIEESIDNQPPESDVKIIQSLEIENDIQDNYDDFVFGNHISVLKPFHLGNLICLLYILGHPIIVIGKEKLSLVFSYEAILHLSFFLLNYFTKGILSTNLRYANTFLYFILFFCHMWIFLSNPGLPSRKFHPKSFKQSDRYLRLTEPEKENYSYCEICHILREPLSFIEHCEDCGICVSNFDHHCVWTGKCITRYNIWAFYTFSIGSFCYIILFFICVFQCLIKNSKTK